MCRATRRLATPAPVGRRALVGALSALVPVFLSLVLAATSASAADATAIADHLRRMLERPDGTSRLGQVTLDMATLGPFYAGRDYRPVWVGGDGPDPRVQQLVEILARAETEGLDPDDYARGEIEARRHAASAEGQARLELVVSNELGHYMADLSAGRLKPQQVDPELFIRSGRADRVALLERAAGATDLGPLMAVLAPANRMYGRLREVLARYRGIAERGGWPRLPGGPALKRGARDHRVRLLRARLRATGDLVEATDEPDLFDADVERAVKRYQERTGLAADGVVGRLTRDALNTPVRARIRKIVTNMERWRWTPVDLGRRRVLVNIAGFDLEVLEGDRTVMTMRAVVGKAYRRTPVFSSRITDVMFNPPWTVPPKIAGQDLLPKIRDDSGYLADNGFRVFDGWGAEARELDPRDIDWWRVRAARFPYRLRQDPGPGNALGRVKFVLPNPFDVYLHDTPDRSLFDRPSRTFSSGCIRIEKPLEFAEYLLRGDPAWPRDRIDTVLATGRTIVAHLANPVPVYVAYGTAWVEGDGTVHFRHDVYGRDARLMAALARQGR